MWFRLTPFSFYIIVRFRLPNYTFFFNPETLSTFYSIYIGIFEAKTLIHSFALSKLSTVKLSNLNRKNRFWKLLTVICYLPRL